MESSLIGIRKIRQIKDENEANPVVNDKPEKNLKKLDICF